MIFRRIFWGKFKGSLGFLCGIAQVQKVHIFWRPYQLKISPNSFELTKVRSKWQIGWNICRWAKCNDVSKCREITKWYRLFCIFTLDLFLRSKNGCLALFLFQKHHLLEKFQRFHSLWQNDPRLLILENLFSEPRLKMHFQNFLNQYLECKIKLCQILIFEIAYDCKE